MYFDLLNISNTLPSGLASLEAVQLVQSKIRWSNLRFSPVNDLQVIFRYIHYLIGTRPPPAAITW